MEKQLHIFRCEQVLDRHTQIHETVHGKTNLVELMVPVGKIIMLLLVRVEGAEYGGDIAVEGMNLLYGVSECAF